MKTWRIFLISSIFITGYCQDVNLTFPEYLKLGVSTAAYQTEGAWNATGKGENVWDFWTHKNPSLVADGSNGDVACDTYNKYKEDVQMIKNLGFNFFRMSISWARILPSGFTNVRSEDGIQYYKNFITELLANDIEPVVTIYHWDHPQVIEDMGGWTNDLIVDWFVDYARIIFTEFGPYVKIFSTINEPKVYCSQGYGSVRKAPGKVLHNVGPYLCGHNVLKAHAKVYHMYDDEFRATQQGKIGMVLSASSHYPLNADDKVSADTAFQFECGWFMNPIFIGDYPEIMKTRIDMISKQEGSNNSRLPEFTPEWITYINGTADYFGLNHYSSDIVEPDPEEEFNVYNTDEGIIHTSNSSWPTSSTSWLWMVPEGFGDVLRKIKNDYGNPTIFILENGYSDEGELDDYDRIEYYYSYLKELLIAVKRDGCKVERYSVWSILDNFEWSQGYTKKFGIVGVDFDNPARNRTYKLSAKWWETVIQTRTLQEVPRSSARNDFIWSFMMTACCIMSVFNYLHIHH